MTKMYCDRCGKELDEKAMKYVGLSLNDYESDEGDSYMHWDFCHDCSLKVKQNLIEEFGLIRKSGDGE